MVSTQGENGSAFALPIEQLKPFMMAQQKKHNYNVVASNIISWHRSVPDLRFAECLDLSYPERLPTTSVIIIFHNEALSTLMRTVWSVIDRSPRQLLAEIILVDDFSSEKMLQEQLDSNIEQLQVDTKIIRNKKREGLIRSRLIGAKEAKVRQFHFYFQAKSKMRHFYFDFCVILGRSANILRLTH